MKTIAVSLFVLLSLTQAGFGAVNQPPPALVQAVITVESGGKPLAVQIEGATYFPDTREEALRLIAKAVQDGRNFDVGLMQVNSWWMKRFDISPESLLDPETNMAWGTAILADEITRHGLNWLAVGRYHSPDTERGRRYAWKVYRNYARRTAQEKGHGKTADPQNLSDRGGIRRNPGVRPQSGAVAVDVQQTGVSGNAGSKSGTSGSAYGTAKD
jgi:hypothetical protein